MSSAACIVGWGSAAVLLAGIVACSLADDRSDKRPHDSDAVIARVSDEPIYQRELDRELAPAKSLLDPQAALPGEVKEKALAQLIDRRLVLAYLIREKLAASEQDVDLELSRLKQQFAAQEKNLTEHLKANGVTLQELRREMRWRLSWQRYLAGKLTDENLQKYFERYRREYDGTELKVAHLLLKAAADDPLAIEAARKKAEAIRAEIEAKKTTFADACRRHSQAPTAAAGGEMGFIRRHEPMPEPFSAAAFALEKGAVSQPVATRFGIHLVQVLDENPGKKTWQECRAELRSALTQYLFASIASKERETAKVESN